MAKQRKTNNIFDAIAAIADAVVLDTKPNKTEEEQQQIHEATKIGVEMLKDSNLVTLAAHADDFVETRHQVDEVFEDNGIDPVQFARDNALAGAQATVEAIAAAGDQQMAELEEAEQDNE